MKKLESLLTAALVCGTMCAAVQAAEMPATAEPIRLGMPVQAEQPVVRLTLTEAVNRALATNYAIGIAAEKQAQAAAQVSEVAANKNPSLSYSFGVSKFKEQMQTVGIPIDRVMPGASANLEAALAGLPLDAQTIALLKQTSFWQQLNTVPYRVQVDHGYQNSVSLTWPLWTGGRVEHGIEAARIGRDVAEWEVYRQEADVKYQVTEGFYKLIEARNLLAIADEAVANLQEHVRIVGAHYDAGTVAKIDVLSSRVALANAQEQQIQAQNGTDLARTNLNTLLRQPTNTQIEPVSDDTTLEPLGWTLPEAVAFADTHRWELQQARLAVQAAKEQLGVAKAGYLPTVAVQASMNWQDRDFPGFKNEDWSIAGGISWSLFDGGATGAKVTGAEAGVREAELTAEQAAANIELDVTNAYLATVAAEKRIRTTSEAVNEALEAYKIATVRYRAGVGINLDVLDAQLKLNQARTNYVTALYDYHVSMARLEQAIGVPAAEPTPVRPVDTER